MNEEDGRTCIASPRGAGRGVTVMIDNYDSFTYNVVQLLVEEGANLVIFRNDRVTLEQIEALDPVSLVISPGPGHPLRDAGISSACIERFVGRIPILGICMGMQCMVTAYGGVVEFAGEIFHGKTSPITHDGCGLFAGMDAATPLVGTRYHSLSARITALPPVLVETARVDSRVVMGVRHREYTMEGVQYHPESIMSEGGRHMMAQFLSWRGGTWAQNPGACVEASGLAPPPLPATIPAQPSILERIYEQRRIDVAHARAQPGRALADLERSLALQLDPPQISFPARLLLHAAPGAPGVMAEVKRASPSKGDIAPHAHAAEQALSYARGGASVISVLTEPTWFRGTLEDLALARRAVERLPQRPAILRKDFMLDEYQIAEARLAGADTVLLIVAMLDDTTLRRLYDYSMRLGMDPLVEVNTAAEMERALVLAPRVIGVNNRNLHSFHVDMGTTTRLAQAALERGTILVALSGIAGRADVEAYAAQGVHAVLVGEALMRAADKSAFVAELQGRRAPLHAPRAPRRLVKVCGVRSRDAALAAAAAGADLVGLILAPRTRRTVTHEAARAIVAALRGSPRETAPLPPPPAATDWFTWHARCLADAAARRPLVVGVFRDQPLDEIVATAAALELDAVQLHGRIEPLEWARYLPGVFVIRVFHVDATLHGARRGACRALDEATRPGCHHVILFDTAGSGGAGDGGTGAAFDWSSARTLATSSDGVHVPFMIAGGITPANVGAALAQSGALGTDTSSGVETDGEKDAAKIRAYVEAAQRA